MTAGNSICCYV